MLLLAIDTTTAVCSVALGRDGELIAEYLLNIKKTHSQRLMPLISSMLRDSDLDRFRLEGICVAVGPGSFTGIRIGVATARGLAQGLGIPLVGVNTLEALAGAGAGYPALLCPLLDARRGQVYAAVYRGGASRLETVEPPRAIALDDLGRCLLNHSGDVFVLGDNLPAFREVLVPLLGGRYREMPPAAALSRASYVLQRGFLIWREEGPVPLYALNPLYLRLPEAQRRLMEQQKGVEC